MNGLWIALAIAVSSTVGPLLLARQLNKQRQLAAKEKAEDRRREDEVAAEALKRNEEVAETAAQAAALLLEAQKETTRGTDEVARLAAVVGSVPSKVAVEEATPIVLFYPNGQREEVVLSGVPRVGERVRLRNGRGEAALVVEAVLWMEAFLPPPNPSVIVVVRAEEADEESRTTRLQRGDVEAHEQPGEGVEQ